MLCKKLHPYIFAVCVLLLAACPFGRDKVEDAIEKAAKNPGQVLLSYEVRQTTPKGAVHIGKYPLSDRQLRLIDEGIAELFASAAEDGFNEKAVKPSSWFQVFTPPYQCRPSPVTRTPGFLVGAGWIYDGTDYDQYNTKGRLPRPVEVRDANGNLIKTLVYKEDGYSAVFASEFVISIGTPESSPPAAQFYVCPDEPVLKAAVRHGGDHAFAGNFPYLPEWRKTGPFDGYAYFNRSLYHTAGIGHPLFPRGGRFWLVDGGPVELTAVESTAPEEKPLSDEMKTLAGKMDVPLTGSERTVVGQSFSTAGDSLTGEQQTVWIIRAVK
jgi:hypothetical protein